MELVNIFLQDLFKNKKLFGGLTVCFFGDVKQCLPILKGANQGEIIKAVLIYSDLFKYMVLMQLSNNLRIKLDKDEETNEYNKNHLEFVKKMGLDMLPKHKKIGKGYIQIPDH
jgi:hypothetical protein